MKILVIDNYDSFTYNLVQYIQEITDTPVSVFRNDAISLEEVALYDVVILSPGPGVPSEAGIMPELIKQYASTKPILGVCLGHQAIGEAFGGTLENLKQVYHGVETPINLLGDREPIFEGVPERFQAGRYHSWVVRKENLPDCFLVTAEDDEGMVMAFRHKEYKVMGLQFHPESIMTEHGKRMLDNFFKYYC